VNRSATIRSLIARLGTSDVIVYLQRAVIDRAGVDGRTSLMSAVSGTRMVRVIIRSALANDRAVEMLGHELQHVYEIALEPRVRSEAAFQHHLKVIGFESATGRFETEDAMQVERRIRSELKPARQLMMRRHRPHHSSSLTLIVAPPARRFRLQAAW
jgi:hypothetical protein